ncbi:hypothetical protein [Mesorhizobium sp. M0276]|uniref:hypothetical protein n=1 Tax=Mesorhizobium sp. M0276 TaxID=2956928 RepID=UPI003337006A
MTDGELLPASPPARLPWLLSKSTGLWRLYTAITQLAGLLAALTVVGELAVFATVVMRQSAAKSHKLSLGAMISGRSR